MFKCIFKSSRSATFELNNSEIYYSKEPFSVKLDGEIVLKNVLTNVFSIYGLKPNTSYEISVNENTQICQTKDETLSLNVLDFGAIGDGIKEDTASIQMAIHAAPNNSRVFIPAGTYLTGPIFLKSNLLLELEKGATLIYLTDRNKYPQMPPNIAYHNSDELYELGSWEGTPDNQYASMITGFNVENTQVIGLGVFDGNAQNGDWWDNHKTKRGAWRPNGLYLAHSNNVSFQGITVKNTPSWNLHPYFSNNLDFIDMVIESPKDSPNTDGCDPESCKDVNIIGVNFSVGDDCIALKSGKYDMGRKYKTPCENIYIRNCIMQHGHGAVVLGSEMSGGMKNIFVTQCYFNQTDRGLRIKTRRGRGKDAIIDGITFENIYMKDVLTPLVMNMYYFCDPDGKQEYVWSKNYHEVDERTPYLGEFTFKNMVCENAHVSAGFFYGLPEQPIKKVTLENIKITYSDDPIADVPAMMSHLEKMTKQGFYFNHVEEVNMINVEILGQTGEEVTLLNVEKSNIKS